VILSIKRYSRKYPEAVKHANKNGEYPLHIALRRDHTFRTIMDQLLDLYPDVVYQKNCYDQSPLHIACEKVDKPHGGGHYPEDYMVQKTK
jgi:ankyrin repeat protein